MFNRYEEVDLNDSTVRNYTMLYERDASQDDIQKVKDFLKKENLAVMRMGSTLFLEMTNKQFDGLRRLRAVAGCGLEQKARPA